MKVQPSTLGWLTVTGALVLALGFSHCSRPDPADNVPAPVRKTTDSLATTRPDFEERRDSVSAVVTIDTARAARAERLTRAAKDSAEVFRKRADSLAAQARIYGDSTFLWRLAYENRTEEAGELRTALDSAQSAIEGERAARLNLAQLWREAERRRAAAEEVVIPGLERAIAKLDQPCRIVGPIKCPSRRVAFVAGALGAVVVVSAVK